MITLEPPRGFDVASDAWRALGLSRAGLSRFLGAAQTAVGLQGEVDVLLTDDRTLRRLNREFRGKDKATDVLSFPAAGEMAGDLAVSLQTAARQAAEHGHTLRDEVRVLLLHGLLHLDGMDHEADGGEMAAREAELRKRLKLTSGLIARAEQQIPFEDDNKKGKSKSKSKYRGLSTTAAKSAAFGRDDSVVGGLIARAVVAAPAKQQIPFEDDNKKSKSKGKGKDKDKSKRRFPAGMTSQKGKSKRDSALRVTA